MGDCEIPMPPIFADMRNRQNCWHHWHKLIPIVDVDHHIPDVYLCKDCRARIKVVDVLDKPRREIVG